MLDALLAVLGQLHGAQNDGLVSVCCVEIRANRWASTLKPPRQVNQLLSFVDVFSVNPKTLYRQHANRLQAAGCSGSGGHGSATTFTKAGRRRCARRLAAGAQRRPPPGTPGTGRRTGETIPRSGRLSDARSGCARLSGAAAVSPRQGRQPGTPPTREPAASAELLQAPAWHGSSTIWIGDAFYGGDPGGDDPDRISCAGWRSAYAGDSVAPLGTGMFWHWCCATLVISRHSTPY